MKKDLSEMTLSELWQLFPIILAPPDENWQLQYEDEAKIIENCLNDIQHSIYHIGSTAIPGIWAKPTVDILLHTDRKNFDAVSNKLSKIGYGIMNKNTDKISMQKGYTPDGFSDKVYHLHITVYEKTDELYFRDWLRENRQDAIDYESLKLSLWKKYEHDRDGYTEAKSNFVKQITAKAKEKYKNRY